MKGSLSVSILSYLDFLKPFSLLNANKFNWLLLFSSVPVFIAASTVVTIAAPQIISQATPAANINRPTLSIGSQGERVSELQAALKLLGFYTGAVDGIYNTTTASAVSRFKQAAGLNPDGIVDPITWQRLFPSQPIAVSTVPSPKPTSSSKPTVIVPSQSNNIRRTTTTPRPEPRPAQPRQTTNPKPQKTTVRTTTTRTTPTSTPQIPRFEHTPGIQYTTEGLPILRLGNRGSEVGKLQEVLKRLGFLDSDVDGDFGPTTEAAVKAAQSRYGLEADGVAGGGTWEVFLGRLQRQR
ncbi:peptidoglycan-binding domain-containing protein [Nostoc sp. 106C]|jgi:peptidoglycan hydrolase-like protein with peptidoglycan-binding domain|uniref:peptidoglycan-binding domain-containing protein n=1 Tax=Nostoc sp. 106C TaxID=1932667 RepID=UPI000A384999|nr:peptidoglycan-binding domain-containing protein [Nostoc sp. 106C]OUL21929.1 peptidoglycan-binding protein [Nostoc sp. RF31YmG]OUL33881.1 peptidoglycan-binding protein [Nostoc sp. 106C]